MLQLHKVHVLDGDVDEAQFESGKGDRMVRRFIICGTFAELRLKMMDGVTFNMRPAIVRATKDLALGWLIKN